MSDIPSQGTTMETADIVESQEGNKSEVTEKTLSHPITPPDIASQWLFDPFTNELCASNEGLKMCSGVNNGPENGEAHSPVLEPVEEEEIKPLASQAVDENEPDIPISQRGDEEDIVDEMKRREEERKLYLALYSALEKRGFRFLWGGQKVFQAVLEELTDQSSG
ncbi:hypothetical protein I308_105891 [Cryptococcus tetragattii IND107]|uniref:Uncharacterized protein n=1 Tax=Cryptococcus tetragattii IND107 TaxID=1296105 RepID=A0ABR3BKE4_9TREE